MRVSQRETSRRVIKLAIRPLNGVVAGIARHREAGSRVSDWRCRVVVISLVASDASRAGQTVIVVDMAIGAQTGRNRMISGKREPRTGMVEGGVHPVRGVVALVAGLREVCCHVIRVCRSLVVLQVAAHASRCIQAVIIVDVAVSAGAWRHRVQTSEREARTGVVEGGVHPVGGVVARIASLWEIRCDVIRIGRALEILQMAAHARRAV